MIVEMEKAGQLDRALEGLPSEEELDTRTGLTSPELAVLLAYTKIIAEREIGESSLPDDAWTHEVLRDYFPTPLRERYEDRMAGHRLRREIITTEVVNEVVNRGGISFLFRTAEETGASLADIVRAFVVVREAYGLRDLWKTFEALDNRVPIAAQTALYLEVRRLVDRAVRWLVTHRRSPIQVTEEIERLRPGVSALLPSLDEVCYGQEQAVMKAHAAELAEQGIPEDVARWATRVMYGFGLLDIVEVAHERGRDVRSVAAVYYLLSERFGVDALLSQISALPRNDRWQTMARMALRYDLYAALAALTAQILASSGDGSSVDLVEEWEEANAASIARTTNAMGDFRDSRADLAALSVLLRQIRTLVQTTSR
jgi:glutamate dehydrogenase